MSVGLKSPSPVVTKNWHQHHDGSPPVSNTCTTSSHPPRPPLGPHAADPSPPTTGPTVTGNASPAGRAAPGIDIPFTTTVPRRHRTDPGFGTWEVEGDDAVEGVRDALVAGYRHVDTAYIYGNEELVGEGISRSSVARDDFWLTTKVWKDAYAPDDVRSAERS